MGTQELGQVELVEVRTIWEHEAHNFTPWLADNLNLLGDELGMKLELVGTEAQFGSYYLDILARDANEEVYVAIENQLESADFTHLGQLLTYATGHDARVSVWVAPHFTEELRAAIDWLNRWTSEELQFFAVEIRAIKIGGSLPAPELRTVASPVGWSKGRQSASKETLARRKQFLEFFEPLKRELLREGFAERAVQRFDHTGRHFHPLHSRGVQYAASLEGENDAWVTLHLEMEDRERTKEVFDALEVDREEIESCFDPRSEWHWRRYDKQNFSSINLRQDGSIDDSPDKLAECRGWMAGNLREFKKVFDPRLAAVLNGLPRHSEAPRDTSSAQ